jgi:shikimate dehydrogenase
MISVVGFDELEESADVIINATSSGGAELIDPRWLMNAFCYDMSYGRAATFCTWAEQNGARVSVDGLGMLVEQAAQSYFLGRGNRPQTDPVVAQLRDSLAT